MCDFHSTVWRMLGQDIQMLHAPHNSHSQMIEEAGWPVNQPNRKPTLFEAEWDGYLTSPCDATLIRNTDECPEPLKKAIRTHYERVEQALKSGKYFSRYFADTKKWSDVWGAAIERGVKVKLPQIFEGSLNVARGLDVSTLVQIDGNLSIGFRQKANMPQLSVVNGSVFVNHAKLIAPKLTFVSGDLRLYGDATAKLELLYSVGEYFQCSYQSKINCPSLRTAGTSLCRKPKETNK